MTSAIPQPFVVTPETPVEPAVPTDLQGTPKNFQYYQKRANAIIADWDATEHPKILVRREMRKNIVNVEDKRQKSEILSDETFIPDRTIDYNVRTQKALYVRYIEEGRRLLIFGVDPGFPMDKRDDVAKLEDAFTQGMRYNRWKNAWFQLFDGTCLHGACACEVIFDDTKPLNCAVDYITRDDLRFPTKLKSIQSAEIIMRRYVVTMTEIEGMAKLFGFNPEGVKTLQATDATYSRSDEKMYEIYKCYYKQDGIVMTCWYSSQYSQDWLSAPKKLDLGIKTVDEAAVAAAVNMGMPADAAMAQFTVPRDITFYPVFFLKYDEMEDQVILDVPGRAALDLQIQEAVTHTLTATVNAAIRASGLYASAEPSNDGETPTNETIGALKHGEIFGKPLRFFTTPWPNNILLTVTQALSVRNQSQMGQTDFAALTRNDTEKTATEIQAAQQQKATLSSMQVNLLATMIIDVYSLCWEIARWQAMLGKTSKKLTSDPSLLQYPYTFSAAGDVEVIQRAEKKQSLREIWMIMKDTPAATEVLTYILEMYFPEEAEKWISALQGPKDQILQMLVGTIEEAIQSGRMQIAPEEYDTIKGILDSARAMVGTPGHGPSAPELSDPSQQPSGQSGEPLPPPQQL